MHEVGIAKEIMRLALEKAGGKKIKSLTIELGNDGHTTPKSLHDAFGLIAKGTAADGAKLSIRPTEALESRLVELEVEK